MEKTKQRWKNFCSSRTWDLFRNSSNYSGKQTDSRNIVLSPSKNLMRPYQGSQNKEDDEKSILNYRLSRARVVENTFGILSQKFQISEGILQSLPEMRTSFMQLVFCIIMSEIKS